MRSARDYGLCPKKAKARDVTIVEAWRNLTGLTSIPQDQQYWTLPGPMYDATGTLQPGCELTYVIQTGLCTSGQFCGAERLSSIHAGNIAAVAALQPGPRLFHGQLHLVMERALAEAWLRPAIVNLDTLYEPRRAARLLGQTLYLLNRAPGVKMVVLNAIVDNARRGRRYNLELLVDAARRDRFCQEQLRYGWLQGEWGWVYNGTGHVNTKMGSLIFFQPFREAAVAS